MRRFLALALLGAIILAGPAGAFKTFRAFGGAVHEGITREAIGGEMSTEAFKIIDEAATTQDNPASHRFTDPTHHFDNNRLSGSREYVETEFDAAVDAAGDADTNGNHRVRALEAFGLLLHTIQDFYSHSNYIELKLKSGTAAGDIRPINWDSPPDGLRTGYFYYSSPATSELTLPRETCVWRLHAEYPETRFATRAQRNALRGDWSSYKGALAYTCGPYDVLHFEMDKDNAGEHEGAVVDPRSGLTFFAIARGVAVAETKRTWNRFLQAIRDTYGDRRAPKIIAALTGKPQPEASSEPLTVKLGADRTQLAVGETATLTAKVTGGQQPYLFAWYVNGGKVLQGAIPTIAVTPDKPGRYVVKVDVFDSQTPPATGTAPEFLNVAESEQPPAPEASPLAIRLGAERTTVAPGEKVKVTAEVSGGTPPYTYAWSLDGVAKPQRQDDFVYAKLVNPGDHDIRVAVTDSADPADTQEAAITVTVEEPQAPPTPETSVWDPFVGTWQGWGRIVQSDNPDEVGQTIRDLSLRIAPYGDTYAIYVGSDIVGNPTGYQVSRDGDTLTVTYNGPMVDTTGKVHTDSTVDTTVKLTVNGDTMTGGEWVAMTDENGSSRFAVSLTLTRAP